MSNHSKKFNFLGTALFVTFFSVVLNQQASAYFIDGEGHYALRPETQTQPGFSGKSGLYQATLQSFRLLGIVRANDQLSFNMEFGIFDNPRSAYLGDAAEPEECSVLVENETKGGDENSPHGNSNNCSGRHQDTNHPGYENYQPFITEAYVKYGFDYCLLEAGRRGRDWGMGIFLDSVRDPFDVSK